MSAAIGAVPEFLDKFEAPFDPLLPGSEQLSLQQRRAIETSGAAPVDFAFLQQAGMFPAAQDPSAALTSTVPPMRIIMMMRHTPRFRIARKLYLERQISVKVAPIWSAAAWRRFVIAEE